MVRRAGRGTVPHVPIEEAQGVGVHDVEHAPALDLTECAQPAEQRHRDRKVGEISMIRPPNHELVGGTVGLTVEEVVHFVLGVGVDHHVGDLERGIRHVSVLPTIEVERCGAPRVDHTVVGRHGPAERHAEHAEPVQVESTCEGVRAVSSGDLLECLDHARGVVAPDHDLPSGPRHHL